MTRASENGRNERTPANAPSLGGRYRSLRELSNQDDPWRPQDDTPPGGQPPEQPGRPGRRSTRRRGQQSGGPQQVQQRPADQPTGLQQPVRQPGRQQAGQPSAFTPQSASGQPSAFTPQARGANGTGRSAFQPLRDAPPRDAPTTERVIPPPGRVPGKRGRIALTTVLVVLGAAVLGVTGYFGFQYAAPYFGGGYRTGASTTLDSVRFTTREASCGDTAPDSDATPTGQFCVITVDARDSAPDGRLIDFHDWSVDLDVGIGNVPPILSAMRDSAAVVVSGQTGTMTVVFDVPKGSRLSRLHIVLDGHRGSIALPSSD